MDYKRYDMGNLNLHIIKMDNFKTVNMRIYLKRKIKKEEINYRNFLSDILLESCNKYKTRRELQIEKEELYNVSLSGATYKSGLYTFLAYSLVALNEKYTEVGMTEKIINLLLDLLLDPYVEDGKFNEEAFKFVKEGIKNNLMSIEEDPDNVATLKLEEYMGKNSPFAYKIAGYLDTLDEVNTENLYEYYKSVIENDIIDIFIIGDVDDKKIKEIFEKRKFRENKNQDSESHFIKLEDTKEEKEVIENKGFVQSKLQMGFKVEGDITDYERKYVLHAYNFILGGGNDSKLFREVREKNSLCYYISSSYQSLYRVLIVKAGINADSYEKTVSLVKQAIKDMSDGKFDLDDLEEVKTIYENACLRIYDNPFEIIENYLSQEYFKNDSIEERIKNMKKVTKEQIVSVAKKIKLDTIYFLEGGIDEEGDI